MNRVVLTLLLSLFALAIGSSLAQEPEVPQGYVNASEILPLPEFVPSAGALYINPENAPVGPWLAYGKDGALIELLYMVPLAQMQDAQNWDALSASVLNDLGVSIDHVDISFNGGHPGMEEAHYHIRLVFVDHETQQAALSE